MSKTKSKISSARTVGTFISGRACSDTLFHVLNNAYDHPLLEEEHAVPPFAGGIMQHGFQCGMLWGAVLAAGAEAYRQYGAGAEAESRALLAAQKLVDSFRSQNQHVNCSDITDLDKSSTTMDQLKYFLLKGGTIGCFQMAAKYAPEALNAINSAMEEKHVDVPETPISCAALLAQKMGVEEKYRVMAAGLAAGIGLSGEVCGALGAAIWIIGLKMHMEEGVKNLWRDEGFNKRFAELMDSFLENSDFEFECQNIVGRKFVNIADHADYVCAGGCSKIIDALAAG